MSHETPDLFGETPVRKEQPPKPEAPVPEAGRPGAGPKPLLKDVPDAPIAPPPLLSSGAAPGRKGVTSAKSALQRQRQGISAGLFWSVCSALLLIIAALCGGALWFYFQELVPALVARAETPAANAAAVQPVPAPDTAALEASLAQANSRLQAVQTQLAAERAEREATQARLQEMADRMALVIQQTSFAANVTASPKDATGAHVADLLPTVSPSTSELILLKERNRLTSFADTAIATGSREALQRIVSAMLDTDLKHLEHAVQAEFKRVQAYYEISVSIDPNFRLPVAEMFKGASARAEADLTAAQLKSVLLDHSRPWEHRLRSAYLLRTADAPEIEETLLKSIKEDPSLDVAKQAQTSFEKRVARRFRLFDIPAIESWWQANALSVGRKPPVPMKEPK